MKVIWGAWELNEKRPSPFDCFDCLPDFKIELDDEDDKSILDFQHKVESENHGKFFYFGEYWPDGMPEEITQREKAEKTS